MALPLLALLPVVAQLAPGLMRALAGDRAGDVTQQVATAVTAVVGSDDPEHVAAAIADPTRAAELRLELERIAAAERQAEVEAETQRIKAILGDVQSARAQTVALAQAGSRIAWMPALVTVALIGMFGAALGWVLNGSIPEQNQRMADTLLGGLYTLATTAVAYWLGTSRGAVEMRQAMVAQQQGHGP